MSQPAPAKKTRRAGRARRKKRQEQSSPQQQASEQKEQSVSPGPPAQPDVEEAPETPNRPEEIAFTTKRSRKSWKRQMKKSGKQPKKKSSTPQSSPFQSIKVQKTSPVKGPNMKKLSRQIAQTNKMLATARQTQPQRSKRRQAPPSTGPTSRNLRIGNSGAKDSPRARMRAAAKIKAHSALSSGLLSGLKMRSTKPRPPFRGLTENGAVTLTTSGNPLVDFFFQVLPTSFGEQVHEYLTSAWDHDPLSALKLVFQLRDIRQGKGDREQFYVCLNWLVERHPETLLANLELFPVYGYWKDLLMFILRIFEGEDALKARAQELTKIRARRDANNERITQHKIERYLKIGKDFDSFIIGKKRQQRRAIDARSGKTRGQMNAEKNLAAGQILKQKAHERRVAERAAMESKLEAKLRDDRFFAQFYDRVVELFAQQLAQDLERLQRGEVRDISLCAKWAPRLGGSFDRRVKLGRMIANKMFPNQTLRDLPGWDGEDRKMGGADEQELSNRIACERYRKEVCVPLRRSLECPEIAMSARRWNGVNYERTPSVAMSLHAKHFVFHDRTRFQQYLSDVADGTKKIACGAVMPHELVRSCTVSYNEVAGLQFMGIVRKLKEEGNFSNSVAVCDVSGSMSGIPMDAAVAFSMILAEMNEGIWHNRIITFHSTPTWFVVPDGNLHEKVQAVRAMPWGGSTNYHGVFTLIRQLAVRSKVQPADMIRRLYVFSDMEFDVSGGKQFETTHAQIKREYKAAGLTLPQIVFWNLRSGDSKAIPASASEKGVALVSGLNAPLLKLFMDGTDADFALEGQGNPEDILEAILASERYQAVQNVVD